MRRSLAVWLGLGVLGVLAGACTALRDPDRLAGGAAPDAGAAWDTGGGALPAADATVSVDAAGPGFPWDVPDSGGSADVAPPSSPDAAPTTGVSAIYWLESGSRTVRRSGANGEDPRTLLTLPASSSLRFIAVDDARKQIYFTDSGTKKIQRVDLDGSDLMDVVVGLDQPMGIDVDAVRGKIYYADQGLRPSVFRANLDGSSAETIVRASIRHPHGVAVHGDSGKLYFTDDELNAVFRANLDGSSLDRLPIAGSAVPGEIAIDPVAAKLYWTDTPSDPTVRRANLDGTGAEVVVSRAKIPSLGRAIGVCLDPLGGRIYLTDGGSSGSDRVLRTDLEGGGLEVLVGGGLSGARGLALAR